MKKSSHIDMVNGPLLKDLVICSIPLLAQGILSLLFSTADCMVVSTFAGDDAVAAVGATSSLSNFLINLFYGVSIGTNVLVARYVGAKDEKAVDELVHTSMTFSIIGGLALVVIGFVASRPLLTLMGTPLDVIDNATSYMQAYFLSMPFVMIYDFGAAILRSFGDTRRPVYFLSIAGVLNVVFDLYFVLVCRIYVVGVALGTVLSQAAAALLMILSLSKDIGQFRLQRKKMRLDRNRMKELLKFGIPAGVQSSLFSLSNMAIQSTVNSFGSLAIAGNTDAGNIESFVTCPSNAVYSACMSFIAINLGARKYDRIKKTVRYSIMLAVLTSGTLGILAYLFGTPLLKIFTSDSTVISAGLVRMSKYSFFYFICCVMDILSGVLRGLGESFLPMIISLTGACAFRIIWIRTVVARVGTLESLYWCFPISWTVVSILFLIYYLIIFKRMVKKNV